MAKTQPHALAGEPLLPSTSPLQFLGPYESSASADADGDVSYILLVPVRLCRCLRRDCRCLGALLASLVLLALGFLLWPADPEVSVPRPAVAVNISGALKVRVRNPNLFAVDYSRLDVAIGYHGAPLGSVTSGGGRVRVHAVSYIDADLHLNGIRVVEDAIYLLSPSLPLPLIPAPFAPVPTPSRPCSLSWPCRIVRDGASTVGEAKYAGEMWGERVLQLYGREGGMRAG